MRVHLSTLVVCLAAHGAQAGETLSFSSGPQQVPLIELFTSEGCSSCPPADAWMSGLKHHPDLWTRFVPVVFHVDYWDHLGWKDRFAKPSFSARQWGYGRVWDINIYTPGFALGGNEWRAWKGTPAPKLSAPKHAGTLAVHVGEEGQVRVVFDGHHTNHDTLIVRMALLGFDQTSRVREGENRGRSLRHDFVTLHYDGSKLAPSEANQLIAELNLPSLSEFAGDLALAVWVERRGNPAPIQATGGWLRKKFSAADGK